MEKIKIIVRKFEKKAGGTFVKLFIGGKFINDVLADENTQYQVKFTAKSAVKEPSEEGIYEVAYNEGECWIDTRPDFLEKHVLRITAQKVKFFKALHRLEKDIREVK